MSLLDCLALEFRWASTTGAHGLPHPDELEWLGFVRVAQHPVSPSSWLMRRESR